MGQTKTQFVKDELVRIWPTNLTSQNTKFSCLGSAYFTETENFLLKVL